MACRVQIVLCAALLSACASESDDPATTDAGSQMQNSTGGSASSAGSGGRSGGSGGKGAGSGGTGGKSAGNGGTGGGGSSGGGTGGGTAVHDAGTQDAALNDAATIGDGFDPGPDWTLAWHDEFDSADGSSPDASRWVFETGGDGFGNNELEFYTNRTENAVINGGMLVITARKESYMGREYTSARLKTQGKFEHTYGRYEARIKIPKGQGIWPAFWMLGNNIGNPQWPGCGEIDIMENIGKEPTTVHGTIHGPGYSGGGGLGLPKMLAGNAPFADDFHLYAMEWSEDEVKWFVDDQMYGMKGKTDLPGGSNWVFDHPFFILLNLAVGGQWPGNPDDSTQFPQTMTVDFVRVYDAK